jgi:hypothetical protein
MYRIQKPHVLLVVKKGRLKKPEAGPWFGKVPG